MIVVETENGNGRQNNLSRRQLLFAHAQSASSLRIQYLTLDTPLGFQYINGRSPSWRTSRHNNNSNNDNNFGEHTINFKVYKKIVVIVKYKE